MSKRLAICILSMLFIVSISACSDSGKLENTTGSENGLKGTVVITGSTSVEKILNDMINEFQAENTRVKINYTGNGSSAGIADTLAKKNDIGAASRELKMEEDVKELEKVIFAHEGIAVVVNPKNKVKDITLLELAMIYSGQITNWSELGGDNKEIVVVSREGSSGTRVAFEELSKLEDAGGLTQDAIVVEGNGNMQITVASNPNAVGYVSFSYINETVKAMTIDKVEPTADNTRNKLYGLSRQFIFVHRQDNTNPCMEEFLKFILSESGQEFVEEHGGIRVD